MAYPRILAEIERRRRLTDPKNHDNGSYQLIKLMGAKWWVDHGFHREYEVGGSANFAGHYIDMAHPDFKWAIEADGDAYHLDVIKEMQREEFLRRKGWYIQRFRWVDLVRRPEECRTDIIDMYNALRPSTPAERKALDEAMRKSGL